MIVRTSSVTESESAAIACPLKDALNAARCGGKACNLARMIRLGMQVPEGLVVTNQAFQMFIDENGLRSSIAQLIEGLDIRDPQTFQTISHSIRQRIKSSDIPVRLWASVQTARSRLLGDVPLAVRSSAVGEDSKQATFAGQLDSFLEVSSDQELREAILNCWSSYWSDRSLFYQHSRDIDLQGMGVVIQQMAPSAISGVLFTSNPDAAAQARDEFIAEYCGGYGDLLVSGLINPGRLTISRCGSNWERLCAPDRSDKPCNDWLVNDDLIRQLADAGATLEHLFGQPQDIEWTVDTDGRLYLLQSRPITVQSARAGFSGSTGSSGENSPKISWSNANVNENFPAPISPFLYSIASAGYYHYFRNLAQAFGITSRRISAMEFPLRHIIGVHGGRMYYNLSSVHSVLRAAPCGEMLAAAFNDFVGVADKIPTDPKTTWKSFQRWRIVQLVELGRIAVQTTWQFLFLSRRVARFERTVDEFAVETAPHQLEPRCLKELLRNLRSFVNIRCHRWTNASLADAAAMISYGLLKRFLNREFPERDSAALHNTLLKGLQNIVSSVPVVKLWQLSCAVRANAALTELFATRSNADILESIRTNSCFTDFRVSFESFLADWGFRCSGELMLTVPSFQEQPTLLLDVLKVYLSSDADSPVDQLKRQSSDRKAELNRVLGRLRKRKLAGWIPWPKALVLRCLLRAAHKSIALRERARLKQALLYSRCRRIALAIGARLASQGHLDDQEDVFYLTYQELDDLLSGRAMYPDNTRNLVQLRSNAHRLFEQIDHPDNFALAEGSYLNETDAENPKCGESDEWCHESDPTGTEMSGVGACGGIAVGPAAVLDDVSEFPKLKSGDVLVTRQTDPGWAPVFFLIKGLVMERGGMLSHGAILAREYGIPTVVGIADAANRIPHGKTLSVNGDRGVVKITD